MAGHGKGDARKVVLAAMLGNGGIAVAKFIAAFFTGSVTMLAEGVHSVADTVNQALLLVGMTLSKKEDPQRYPLGRAKETYFWAFVVALMLFFMGGVVAIYEGVHKLLETEHTSGASPLIAIVVLLVSLCFEAGSFYVAITEFNKSRGRRSLDQALFQGKDPTIPVVLLEDTGAMLGLVVALVAVTLSWITGSTTPDAIGSIIIGILLCGIGVALAFDTRSLLIGEGVSDEVRQRVIEIAEATPGLTKVTQFLSYHLGPETVMLALKVRFADGSSLPAVEECINRLEERIRAELPQMRRIFIEPDGHYVAPNG
jgi:cation diffusion facilitator family transporter